MNILYKSLKKSLLSFIRNKEGSLITIAAGALPVILLAAGAATDYTRVSNVEYKLAAAVDAATQNVATMLEQYPDPQAKGNEFFLANFPNEYMGAKLLSNEDGPLAITHGKVGKELRVTGYAAADLPLVFGGILGINTYRIEHRATVARVVKPNVEIVLAVDVSPSMCTLSIDSANQVGLDTSGTNSAPASTGTGKSSSFGTSTSTDSIASSDSGDSGFAGGPTLGGGGKPDDRGDDDTGDSGDTRPNTKDASTFNEEAIAESKAEAAAATNIPPSNIQSPVTFIPDPNCTKLTLLKEAMKKFVEHVFDNSAIDNVKIGIVPYNHKVKFANPENIPPSIANGESATPDYYTNLTDASPLPDIVPLTSNETQLIDAINSIHLDLDALGWTRTNLGAHAAAAMLDPANNQYFGGESPRAFGDSGVEKIIVHMTDGANTGCCWVEPGEGYIPETYSYLYKTDMDDQAALCEVLKAPVSEGGGNITIFPVVFDVKDTDYLDNLSENISGIEREGGKWIKQVFKGCASNSQFYFDVPVVGEGTSGSPESEIEKAYLAIASWLYKVRFIY